MQRLRRTMMFVPGNNPGMMQDAYIYGPDSIMLDLEDSVTMAEKDALEIDLDSTVAYQFGAQIKKVIAETLHERGIDKAHVKATDKGALDCTIRARVTAAAVRATGQDVWKD